MFQSLRLLTYDNRYIGDLINNSDYCVTDVNYSCGANEIAKLTFNIPFGSPKQQYLIPENVIELVHNVNSSDNDKYIIKETKVEYSSDGQKQLNISCQHLSCLLSAQYVVYEEILPNNPTELLKQALLYENGTPTLAWIVGSVDETLLDIKRGFDGGECSVFEMLVKIAEKYDAYLDFDCRFMRVNLHKIDLKSTPILTIATDYNATSFNATYDTSELITRMYCYGASKNDTFIDITSVNKDNLPYIEDYSYFEQLGYSKEYIENNPQYFTRVYQWQDENYTDPQALLEQGKIELSNRSFASVDIKATGVILNSKEGKALERIKCGDIVKVHDVERNMIYNCYVENIKMDSNNPNDINLELSNNLTRSKIASDIFASFKVLDNNAKSLQNGTLARTTTLNIDSKIQSGMCEVVLPNNKCEIDFVIDYADFENIPNIVTQIKNDSLNKIATCYIDKIDYDRAYARLVIDENYTSEHDTAFDLMWIATCL